MPEPTRNRRFPSLQKIVKSLDVHFARFKSVPENGGKGGQTLFQLVFFPPVGRYLFADNLVESAGDTCFHTADYDLF
ncbi:MAG: hypothetical protein ACLU99_03115 [Alphaproteobacteria bacterium]